MKMTGRDGTIEVEGVAYKGHSDRVMSHSVKQQNLSLSPSVSVCVFRTITLSTICLFAVTAKTEMTGSRSLLPAARGKKARLNIRVRLFFAVPACVCPRLLFFFCACIEHMSACVSCGQKLEVTSQSASRSNLIYAEALATASSSLATIPPSCQQWGSARERVKITPLNVTERR